MLGEADRTARRFRPNMGYPSRPLLARAWGRVGALVGLGLSIAAACFHYFVFGLRDLEEPAASAHWLAILCTLTLGYALCLVPSSMMAAWRLSSDHNNNLF